MQALQMRILFVCLGNICRSPLAEAVFRHEAHQRGFDQLDIDSAGTAAYHVGETADPRSIEIARRNGVAVTSIARQVSPDDFSSFDLIVAMDAQNRSDLLAACPDTFKPRVRMMRDWDPAGPGDVPDPYYGGASGFEDNFAMLTRCCRQLLDEVHKTLSE